MLATLGESVGVFDSEVAGAYIEVFRLPSWRLTASENPAYLNELARVVGRGRERAGLLVGHEALAHELESQEGVYYLARQTIPNSHEGWVAYSFSKTDPTTESRGPHVLDALEAVDYDFGTQSCRRGAAAILHLMFKGANESDQIVLKAREQGEETRSAGFFASTAFRALPARTAKRKRSRAGLFVAYVGEMRDAILLNYGIGTEPSS